MNGIEDTNVNNTETELPSPESQFQQVIDRLGLASEIPNELKLRLTKLIPEYFQLKISKAVDELDEREQKIGEREKEFDATDKELRDQQAELAEQKNAFKSANEGIQRRLRDEEKRNSDQKMQIEGELKKLEALRKQIEEKERTVEIREKRAESGLEQNKSEWEKIKAEREQNQKDAQENIDSLSALEKACLEAKQEKESANKTLADTIELQKRFWPDCLLTQEWEIWRAKLQERALVDPNAAVLLAALHMCYAAAKTDKNDLMYEALWQTGAHLFPRFSGEAQRLAEAFNEMADRRFRLQLPKQGQPTDSIWMNFKPGLTTVSSVFSWAVFDSDGRLRHRANVK